MNSSMSYESFRYYYYDVWQSAGDPRVTEMPLMNGGPWTVVLIISVYVYFVKFLGPQFMSNRKAFDLRSMILFYNIFMVIANGFFFYLASIHTTFGYQTWLCVPMDDKDADPDWKWKLDMGWLYLMSKFVDLFDTIFFVLRKKNRQISALHVIHHSLVPINCWFGFKYVPSESAAFMPFINSFVHCVMYSYYALSTLGPSVRRYLWWKKYLTTIQIVQIALVAVHCLYLGMKPQCNLPKVVFLMAFPQSLLVLFMFCSFFTKNYTTNDETTTKKWKSN